MVANNPGFHVGTVPRTAVPRWTRAEMLTLADSTQLVCHTDRPDDEVEQVARIIYDHRAEFAQRDPSHVGLDSIFAASDPIALFHIGSERFFRSLAGRS